MVRWAICGLSLTPMAATAEEACWPARLDALTSPDTRAEACFTVIQEGSRVTARITFRGRMLATELPAPLALPLEGRVRLQDPWATFAALKRRKPLANLGWNLWGGRPAPVRAAAAGTVLSRRVDPVHGTLLEIDHGSGLRTRYALNRFGSSTLAPGTRVAAGEVIGELGAGLPDDIPFVHFGLLLDAGGGQLLALDPAPFVFASAANRALPLATSVLNAAVRAQEPGQASRLLQLGLDPNGQAVDGTAALEWAIMHRDPAMARLLVAAGANPTAKTAGRIGYVLEGVGLTLANTGPTLQEMAREMDDPEMLAVLAKP
jgi:murein DD-endopeptidase MepM/ murein hydrolase activator NlpD